MYKIKKADCLSSYDDSYPEMIKSSEYELFRSELHSVCTIICSHYLLCTSPLSKVITYPSTMKGPYNVKVVSLRACEIDELMSWERLTHILMPAIPVLTPRELGHQTRW